MCISCVRNNMILNDHKSKPQTTKIIVSDASSPVDDENSNENQVNSEVFVNRNEANETAEKGSNEPRNRYDNSKTRGEIFQEVKKTMLTLPPQLLGNNLHYESPEYSSFKKMKRSFSFGGFGVFCYNGSIAGITSQEIESMVDPVTKKEPSKLSKKQIKEYATKYKHVPDEKNKKLPWYRDPLEYTQPAHLVTCIAFVYLAFRLFPDSRRSPTDASTLTRLLYVSSVSAVFGAQFWMTFVSGLALFFTVSRHIFAKVQSVLFPLYFLTNAALMFVAIITYTQHHPTHMWDNHQMIQGCILVFGFIINLGIRLYLAPILSKLITIKVAIEAETGLGNEIGSNRPGVLSRCPHYMRLYQGFRKLHIIIAIGNMSSMAATSLHLYYLATKLCSQDL